ncbi:MAG TPA: magnesium/cobalt transporter CorA [Ignavibacteria bacterium]|nr:magnesium/cobalt transporter CorA [Ignavibacteria bacterium]
MISIIKYCTGKGVEYLKTEELAQWDYNSKDKIWVDIYDCSYEENNHILKDVFNFHPLAIEDSLKYLEDHQVHHPKIDDFNDYLFIVFNGLTAQKSTFKYELFSMSCFLGHNFIVTIHNEKPENTIFRNAKAILAESSFKKGPDYILNLILDEIVDRYYPLLDNLEDEIDVVEQLIFKDTPTNDTLFRILNIKKELIKLRRISSYQKEVLFKLTRGDSKLISLEESVYYRNVYDHLVRVSDTTESYRDYAAGMLDSYLSIVNNKMNEVMKFLTIIATIVLPLSFVTGLFGMNFEYIPFLHDQNGFLVSIALMVIVAVLMLLWFRHKKWI